MKKQIPKDPQVIIHRLDRVLGNVTFQLPLDFHPNLSYVKPIGLTWNQGGYLLICIMRLCFKPHLNPIRKSKVIDLPMQGTEMGH